VRDVRQGHGGDIASSRGFEAARRKIGGCRSVEMAFWPDSAIEVRLLRPLSNTRPMLVIELAIEPLRR
jgi:hypothetical protein